MGYRRTGSLGCKGNPLRIQDSVHIKSTPHRHTSTLSDLPTRIPTTLGSSGVCRGDEQQGSSGAHPIQLPRLLQSTVRGPKELRRMETRDRLKPPQQDDISDKVSNGDSTERPGQPEQRRLDDLNRPKGRLLSDTDPCKIKALSEIPLGGPSLPVSGLMFRVINSPTGLHESHGNCSLPMPPEGNTTAQIPRRLADCIQDRKRVSTRHQISPPTHRETRPAGELQEVGSNPCQKLTYLGMEIDTSMARVLPAQKRVERLLELVLSFRETDSLPAWDWLRLIGHLVSLEKLVPWGRLHLRSLQFHLKEHWAYPEEPKSVMVPMTTEVLLDLIW